MESEETKKSKYLVPKGTTHLMMWVGGALPTSRIVRYNPLCGIGKDKKYEYEDTQKRHYVTVVQYMKTSDGGFKEIEVKGKRTVVNYVETLKGECEKMAKNGESCIFVYDSKMVNKEGEEELKKIVREIPNCYLVDYEVFAQQLKQDKNIQDGKTIKSFINHIDEIIEYSKEHPNFDSYLSGIYNIGNLVDCMRMLLLLCPGKLKEIANQQGKQLLNSKDYSLLYNDLDMLQKEDDGLNKSTQTFETNDKQHFFFSLPMQGDGGKVFENGIIFARSQNNSNCHIIKILNDYLNNLSFNEKERKGLYFIINGDEIAINDFSEQYRNEAHRSWHLGKNRSESIMIEFDGDYSSITASKFIAIINWFCENMKVKETKNCIYFNNITDKNDQKKITFVNKKGETTKVSLNDFLQNIIKHENNEERDKYGKLYDGFKNNNKDTDSGNIIKKSFSKIERREMMNEIKLIKRDRQNDPKLKSLKDKIRKFERFIIACSICFGKSVNKSAYQCLFDFDAYKAKLIEEKIDSSKGKNIEEKVDNAKDENCVYSSIGAQNINNNNINFNISHSELETDQNNINNNC